jgi:hypothetical protein
MTLRRLRLPPLLLALVLGLVSSAAVAAPPEDAGGPTRPVPFVGCASDGQTGPLAAPKPPPDPPTAPSAVADSLAFYVSEYSPGVLAPRGWSCFGLYGSNGDILIVTPEAHGQDLFKTGSALSGPAIQLSNSSGETSGRFEVAKIAARLFPNRRSFVQSVIAEGLRPASDFPTGPFPADQLTRVSANLVEFETPAHADGMGTASRLVKDAEPIAGFAQMTKDDDLTVLEVRLPPNLRALAPVIIRRAEQR